LGESKLPPPILNQRNQLTSIDLPAGLHHPPIVKSLVWQDELQTQQFAAALAQQAALRQCYVELHGELGAGKTTLVRHLLQAMGVAGRIKSPTYTIVEPYELPPAPGELQPLPIWHFDFYRFNDPQEWEDAGFREIFSGPGLKLAEWPDKAAGFVPRADLVVRIEALSDGARQVQLVGQSANGAALVASVRA